VKLLLLLLKLYPRTWRERYEIEMIALLEEHTITLFTVIDLLFGALDARLDPHYRTQKILLSGERMSQIRVASSTIFWAFPIFWLCWIAFLSDLSDAMLDPLSRFDPLIAFSSTLVGIGFSISLLAMVAAGVFISVAVARKTTATHATAMRFLPLGCFLLVFVSYFIAIHNSRTIGLIFLCLLFASFLMTALLLVKGSISKEISFIAFALMTITAVGMIIQLIGIALWSSSLLIFHGTIVMMSTSAVIHSWSYSDRITLLIAGLVSMSLLTIVAVFVLVRGLLALVATTSAPREETLQTMPPPMQ